MLFQHNGFAGAGVASGLHAVEIDAAGEGGTVVVQAVEDHQVIAGVLGFIYEGAHQLALDVVDADHHRRG